MNWIRLVECVLSAGMFLLLYFGIRLLRRPTAWDNVPLKNREKRYWDDDFMEYHEEADIYKN